MIPKIPAKSLCITVSAKWYCFLFISLLLSVRAFPQKATADSLSKLLETEKIDSNRVNLMYHLARATNVYNPDTALAISYYALSLARSINYVEGESKALSILASTLRKIGNYPRSLELNIQKLTLEEKRKNPRNLASVLISIGTVYRDQEEYRKALEYYFQADSVIRLSNVEDLKYYIALNIGDSYNLLNKSDSAFSYFSKSLELARVYPNFR